MAAQVKQLVIDLHNQESFSNPQTRRAAIMNMTNPHTGTLTLHCTTLGNLTIKATTADNRSSSLYSIPGHSILFAIHQPFDIQCYALNGPVLAKADRLRVTPGNPLVVDGRQTLLDDCQPDRPSRALIGRINLPDRSADIAVFDRTSLRKVAWLPHDASAARYLVSLELLEAVQDPKGVRVAAELVYHYHPAVAWKAFQILHRADPQSAAQFVPLLKKHRNARLDRLLQPLEQAA
ncbi:hypothetical protein [Pseudomonas sp. P97.38]|uniref:hypothetical protein n=1 Tax=Pseudomonas sp. P97.38 TaxID=255451 RepID=UPI00069D0714|nr:hypothetical protein [Pseudomonas sp. P97.38]